MYRKINIPSEISTKRFEFGLLLLDDYTGSRVDSLIHKHSDHVAFNTEVLQEWIAGKGKHPVTWKTLIEVLQEIEHNALAAEIETVKHSQADVIGKCCIHQHNVSVEHLPRSTTFRNGSDYKFGG